MTIIHGSFLENFPPPTIRGIMTVSLKKSSSYHSLAQAAIGAINERRRVDKDVVRAAAHGQWPSVYAAAGLALQVNRHMPCPACGGTDRFRYDDRHGHGDYICNQCGAGDGFSLLQKVHGWSFLAALDYVAGAVGMVPDQRGHSTHRPAPPNKPRVLTVDRSNEDRLRRDLRCLCPSDESIETYFRKRGLPGACGANIYRLSNCLHAPSRQRFDAAVAIFTDQRGRIAGLHRTYLQDGSKAPVTPNKMLSPAIFPGAYRGTALKLFQPTGSTLALAEGIETSLAVHTFTDLPVWAAGSASFLESIIVPDHITEVLIFGDNDANGHGQRSARIAAGRLAADRRRVSIHTPPEAGQDWLDVYLSEGGSHE
ncbi:MAG: toprim domain-containing protein [Desulfuromonadaceae bacterium]|nr:toprim domain-containing protein [Desulfuromonadaceae bacterium]